MSSFSATSPRLVALACFAAALGLPVAAQAPAAPIQGLERWIVVLDGPGLDLSPLRGVAPSGVDALVRDFSAKARASQAELAKAVTERGGRVVQHFWLVPALAVEIAGSEVDALRALPGVARLQADRLVAPSGFIKTSTNARNHGVDALHTAGIKGKGVTIAVLDTGLDLDVGAQRPHRTFFVNGNPNDQTGGGIGGSRVLLATKVGSQPFEDALGHGTAVAAVAAGEQWATAGGDAGHAPLASIAGYSLPDLPNGLALVSTLVTAWQTVAADASRLGIRVANLSYEGTNDPLSVDQQAMDAVARNADVCVVVSAGNNTVSPMFMHGGTNLLAVGAVHADNRQVAAFSNRGPLAGDARRGYPHLVANGVDMVMPQIDNEAADRVASGCSYAAPQVAGAAALYRSVKTAASALETRAALLATTEDVAGKNRVPPYDTTNAYGYGYLRDDRLVALARGQLANLTASGTLIPTRLVQTFPLTVQAGQWYAAAVAWNRQDVTRATWSNLDLFVRQGSAQLGTARSERSTHEKVVFRAPSSGSVDIDVFAVALEAASETFALVAVEALPPFVRGSAVAFGQGCPSRSQLVPVLVASGDFEIGRTYALDAARVDGKAAGFVSLGLSRTSYGPFPLPLFLDPFGAPGCTLWVSLDGMLPFVASDFGDARLLVPLPADRALIAAALHHQALVASPASNALGLVMSNGATVNIGGDPR